MEALRDLFANDVLPDARVLQSFDQRGASGQLARLGVGLYSHNEVCFLKPLGQGCSRRCRRPAEIQLAAQHELRC